MEPEKKASIPVKGYCPMGCGQKLALTEDGEVWCFAAACPEPFAVTDLLADNETDHIGTFDGDGWTLRHPLRERLAMKLEDCSLHVVLSGMNWSMAVPGPGRYRVLEPQVPGAAVTLKRLDG